MHRINKCVMAERYVLIFYLNILIMIVFCYFIIVVIKGYDAFQESSCRSESMHATLRKEREFALLILVEFEKESAYFAQLRRNIKTAYQERKERIHKRVELLGNCPGGKEKTV